MVIWMSASEGDILRIEEFLHLNHLKQSKVPSYWEFKPWDKRSRLVFDSPSPLREWKTSFFFVFGDGWETTPCENLNDVSKLLHRWGIPESGASFIFLLYIHVHIYICSSFLNFAKKNVFTESPCPRLKKRCHNRLEKVRGYIKSISNFNELIYPQSLFLHFLGPEPSSYVQKGIETVKKSKCTQFFHVTFK